MMFKTHLALGFLIAIIVMNFLHTTDFLFLFIILISSALPDLDHPKSKLGRKVKIISFLFEHRGFFHSFFSLFLFTFIFYLIFGSYIYSMAFGIGYLTHILLDSFTKAGITPFAPLLNYKVKGLYKCGAYYDYVFLILFFLIGFYYFFSF